MALRLSEGAPIPELEKAMSLLRLALAGAAVALSAATASAQTATGNFNVRMTVTAECRLNALNDLNFGSAGLFTSNLDQTSTLGVQCTNGTPYSIGLSAGANGSSVSDRRMKNAASNDTVSYQLFLDAGRTQIWGATAGTDTLAGIGTGASQTVTIHGRVPVQAAVATGNYSDTVTVTVNY
jgi:spore coat protein U-like protein